MSEGACYPLSMPRFRQHLVINAVTVIAIDALTQLWEMDRNPSLRFDWGRLAVATAAGCIGGAMPDILEPSLGNPNHRGTCHSLAAAVFAWWLVEGRHATDLPDATRRMLRYAANGYCTHLAADLFLSKGKGMGCFGRSF